MNIVSILKIAPAAVLLALTSCRSVKTAEKGQAAVTAGAFDRQVFLRKVSAAGHDGTAFVTSKVKFRLQLGSQDISLSGNLRMKRGDVIRLQLVALGIMEAGRIEFTPDYVLVMDRINKQYIKVAYRDVEFLRESGLDFHSLQALFWDELFMPGAAAVTDGALAGYNAYMSGTDVAVMLERGPMTYRWMADKDNGQIKTANILYKGRAATQLNWHYGGFQPLGTGRIPTQNDITLTTPAKEVRLGLTLGGIGSDSDWETRTAVPAKYRKVSLDDILRRLTAL